MSLDDIRKFNEEQKKRYWERTQIAVDIENLGKNTQCIAVREQPLLQEIHPYVWFKKECQEFSPGNFTNIYDVFWNPDHHTIASTLHSSNTPYFLVDQIEKDPSAIAVINGGFFFLADVADRAPLDLPYDLNIRDGKLYGLPSQDQPIAYIKNGMLQVHEILAEGHIKIGKKTLLWIGARTDRVQNKKYDAVLYNSRCSEVMKVRDEKNIQIGILDNDNITTPKHNDVIDIVIKRVDDNLMVTNMNKGGGTHFFDGLFILQIQKPTNTFRVGDIVTPLTVDTVALDGITSGITVGRSVHSPFFLEEVRVDRRDARSIIAKDVKGNIHFIVFDGSKYIPGFRGVSAKDISPTYFSPDRFEWAYFLDGGGSTRIIVREGHELKFVANEFAFRKLGDKTILWDWKKARLLTSSIILRTAQN